MNGTSRFSRVVIFLVFAWSCFVPGLLGATTPTSVLTQHSLSATATAAQTVTTSAQKTGKVLLNFDGLVNSTKDAAFAQLFKTELEKLGVQVTLSPYSGKANNHVLSTMHCPSGCWVVTGASGICAGTFRDMVLGRKGYLKKYWEKNNIKGMVFLNLSVHQLKGLKFLPRAWDDNFSPASFKGLDTPYEYITSNGFSVAESTEYTKPVNNPNRVPILAAQIAAIVGKASPTTTSSSDFTLASTAEGDTSQSAEKIKALQKALIAAGYYWYQDSSGNRRNCKIDGWFGPMMKQAVMEYQRDHGLAITGTVNKALYDKLTASGSTSTALVLSSSQVMSLQRGLQACGYYQGCKIDGDFGPYTLQAVKEYQRDHGLQQTGKVDSSLLQQVVKAGTEAAAKAKQSVPAGFEQYLKSSSGSPSSNPTIIAKARSLTGSTPMQTTVNIFNYVESLQYESYYNTKKGALGVLSSGKGNCVDQAHLVVSLLRASGIPALYGHSTDCKFNSGLRCGHVWAYAYVNGTWQALDTTSSKNSVGHLNSFRPIDPIVKKVELSF